MKRYKILIVDNDKSVANALKRSLWQEGYRILTANSGTEALSKMETLNCQLVLADQKMPNMTGIELLSQIKEKYPDTIKILITAQVDLDDIAKDIEKNGIFELITKPWDPEELKNVIRKGLERYDQITMGKSP
ncbi:response regulator [bacterium]|nr:response regulator [bacterium]